MYISWLGQSCFKIQSKDVALITDPVGKQNGLRSPRLTNVDIIAISRKEIDISKAKTEALVIDTPGEYEMKQVFIQGIPVAQNQGKETLTVFWIEVEGMTIGHLGPLATPPSDEELEKLEGLDILLVPVGGHKVLDAKKASQVISQIEPRIVIPMYYKIPGIKEKLDSVDSFCKEMGVKPSEKLEKLRMQKKDLPQDDMKVFVIQSQ
jgi:L-ascorbate metabolism protein UlaG (beta-lactamase superfamily)